MKPVGKKSALDAALRPGMPPDDRQALYEALGSLGWAVFELVCLSLLNKLLARHWCKEDQEQEQKAVEAATEHFCPAFKRQLHSEQVSIRNRVSALQTKMDLIAKVVNVAMSAAEFAESWSSVDTRRMQEMGAEDAYSADTERRAGEERPTSGQRQQLDECSGFLRRGVALKAHIR
jgi:hypothetical protein